VKLWQKIRANIRSGADVWLLLQVFSVITILPLMLRYYSITRLLQILTPKRTLPVSSMQEEYTRKLVKYTDYILRRRVWVYRQNCLRRALVLYHFLRSAGIDVQILFGVRRNIQHSHDGAGNHLDGHAWLVCQGQPFLELNDKVFDIYTVTFRYPAITTEMGS